MCAQLILVSVILGMLTLWAGSSSFGPGALGVLCNYGVAKYSEIIL